MKKHVLLIPLLSVALLALGILFSSRPKSEAGAQLPVVTNKTSAVEVVSLKPSSPTGYDVVLKNVSAKSINGYSVGYDQGASVTNDRTSTSRPLIAPGAEFREWLSTTRTIVIRYVIFDDNSIDGDTVAAAELQERRLGVREQLERIVPLFREATDVDQLRTQIEALPEESQVSIWVTAGMRNAKQDAVLALDKLDKGNLRAELDKFIVASESRMTRLPKRVKP
jgi:hypothetical protein